ncbi:Large exoprotein involved in heme utilization or adhesion (plasmid) [Nostoc flagelliforme CCNUN1]|uniref:Large exoprotein involved in heme utilization or adhesion n=1 Tax=Nostoc flagelliforme CCNUN1 TaxID=2038116 RepID=A0A2K8T9I2_9NOSO|nr:filamentous hemagglutinin N-terminal domain-containing protein [Nostoc flagelliforme]AUB44367.1 Large exoprotein involved in heme utilization or adhesion [Nostoc flagelliforme CCNUN1]
MSGLGFTHWGTSVAIAVGVSLCTIDYANAQITPDGTLPNNTSVTREGNTFNITGGTQAGGNLFHSFGEFSVNTGGTASFNNALDIQNIISRVTGGSVSNIDGLIRASGTANLFLINPNGIIFGKNASLKVGGSFVATTANALQFGNQGFFSASTPNTPALLTVNPNAFLFNQIASQPITSQARLRVPSGKSLLLVGGNVSLNNSGLNAEKIELGGVAGSGTIGLNYDSPDGSNLSLNFPNGVERADVSIAAGCIPDFGSCVAGSNIAINARNIDFSGESTEIGENVTLNATNAIGVSNFGSIRTTNNLNILTRTLSVSNGVLGGANNTKIQANESVFITNGGSIQNSTGGDINIETKSLTLTNEASVNTDVFGDIFDSTTGFTTAGDITVKANSIFLDNSSITALADSDANRAGNIQLNAADSINLVNQSSILSTVKYSGNAGNINLAARTIALDNSRLSTETAIGNSGNIFVQGQDAISLFNSGIYADVQGVATEAEGDGGNITIDAGSLVTEGTKLSTSLTEGGFFPGARGKAGNVSLDIRGNTSLSNSRILSTVERDAQGESGKITIQAGSLSLINNTELQTLLRETDGELPGGVGKGGDIDINVRDGVTLAGGSGILGSVGTGAQGQGGGIKIRAGSLSLTEGARLDTSTAGQGDAGQISLQVADSVSLSNNAKIRSTVEAEAIGQGNDIEIVARSLSVTNGAQLSASTSGQGNAGNIQINAANGSVRVSDPLSRLLTQTNSNNGQGGAISVNTSTFQIANNADLNATTTAGSPGGKITVNANTFDAVSGGQLVTTAFGSGRAGDIVVNATDSVNISGSNPYFNNQVSVNSDAGASGFFARTTGAGTAGDLTITTEQLLMQDGAQVSASTSGQGAGGTLTVNAPQSVKLIGTGSRLTTETTNAGSGGKLQITTGQLLVQDGAEVSASTAGAGFGGTLTVNAPTGFVKVIDAGSSLSARSTDVGSAGNLTITTGQLQVLDGAEVTVSAPNRLAGNLTVRADSIRLDNQGKLTAVTGAGNGGNINLLDLDLLLMRRNSLISAEALGTANGGNITINAKDGFVVAVPEENSDIVANASFGNGGNINITTQGIYGLEYRPKLTELSDITASSQFGVNGTVELNTPGIDPTSGLVELPTIAVATEVAQVCDSPDYAQSSFTITGRGGLPPNPTKDVLPNDTVEVGWVALKPSSDSSNPPVTTNPVTSTPERIVEANGWVVNEKGEVVLTANVPAGGHGSWQKDVSCSATHAHQ